ncbi:low temperature requirement protein LtrA [Kribbella amoyensis]|uniref:Low temperature requirement protein LtrA n=1 Tax=Kribbella amoyensis TaxID=996641 RepID=A0A561BWM7_9ACTN|nr:low temperature requirement protein LtrA [Kribbella amoyensis]
MTARAIDEPHRTASPLELLFDLTFVVAVAAVTAELAHEIEAGHAVDGLVPFLQVFFAIWWAWMNFTWFASSYAIDDVPYRLLTMVQMGGVLVLAAGVPAAAADGDYRAVLLGYLIMRVALVAQWVRAALEDQAGRRTALRYAGGIAFAQLGWILGLVLAGGALQLPVFLLLVLLELVVPLWAERTHPTTWHPHHIAERYGLFAIILLGESVLAATRGVQVAVTRGDVNGSVVLIAASGLVLLFALWWLYFLQPAAGGLSERRERSYRWGYGHYGIFAALAAVGAGLEVAVQPSSHELSPILLSYTVAGPAGAFLLLLWAVHRPIVTTPVLRPRVVLGSVAVLAGLPLLAEQVTAPAVVALTALVAVVVIVLTGIGSGSWVVAGDDEAALVGEDDRLDAVAETEFEQDPGDVRLHGGLADEQLGRDLGVGEAARDQAQDLPFALGQVGHQVRPVDALAAAGEPLDHPPGHLGGEQGVAGVDHLDRLDQVLGRGVLQQEPAGPGAE